MIYLLAINPTSKNNYRAMRLNGSMTAARSPLRGDAFSVISTSGRNILWCKASCTVCSVYKLCHFLFLFQELRDIYATELRKKVVIGNGFWKINAIRPVIKAIRGFRAP